MCEPPQGSATLGMPDSSWMMIWVFLAMRALFTVGNPRASSKELVWRDCVPPNTAAMPSITVRTTLLYGSYEDEDSWLLLITFSLVFKCFKDFYLLVQWETSLRSGSECGGGETWHFWAGSSLGWAWPTASSLPSAWLFPCRNSSQYPRRRTTWQHRWNTTKDKK